MPAFFPGRLTGVETSKRYSPKHPVGTLSPYWRHLARRGFMIPDGELDDQALVGGSDRRGYGANQTACSARL
jgi:hypothetical protein